jgi:hypothetical protein
METMQALIPAPADPSVLFEERLRDILNGGALSLMISLGHRAGLFDVMAMHSPCDCRVLAEQAGLGEAYVRDWLGAMVAGGIVEAQRDPETYRLPDEHAAVLARRGRHPLPALAQWIPLLGAVEDPVLECLEEGGGLEASSYPRIEAARVALAEGGLTRDLERLRSAKGLDASTSNPFAPLLYAISCLCETPRARHSETGGEPPVS